MGKNKSGIITIVVIVLVLIGAGIFTISSQPGGGNSDGVSARDRTLSNSAEKFSTIEGTPADLSRFAGKVQVVNAWATWCPFCVQELPDFEELASEYADQGVVVIAINRKEDPRRVKTFIDSVGDLGSINFFMDPNDDFYSSIGGFSMPETIFYDKNGNEVVHKRGFMALDEMRTHVEAALAASETN